MMVAETPCALFSVIASTARPSGSLPNPARLAFAAMTAPCGPTTPAHRVATIAATPTFICIPRHSPSLESAREPMRHPTTRTRINFEQGARVGLVLDAIRGGRHEHAIEIRAG